jgi:acyl-CoA synthetase (AMP-forming)/AMP-acid ligase II
VNRNLGSTLSGGSTEPALFDLSGEKAEAHSFDALDARADGFAATLTGRGVERGSRVGLCGHNSADFFAALLGTMRAGAVAVP